MIRHLHDLCVLEYILRENKSDFVETAFQSFEDDQKSSNRETNLGFRDSIDAAFIKLRNDEEYKDEYRKFVEALSYADDDETIDFESAMKSLSELITFVDHEG